MIKNIYPNIGKSSLISGLCLGIVQIHNRYIQAWPCKWGSFYSCTMDGFFRIIKKAVSEMICTRLYFVQLCLIAWFALTLNFWYLKLKTASFIFLGMRLIFFYPIYVIMQGICNKFIEVNFCVECMVWRPNCLNISRTFVKYWWDMPQFNSIIIFSFLFS